MCVCVGGGGGQNFPLLTHEPFAVRSANLLGCYSCQSAQNVVHNFAELKDAAMRGDPPPIIFERLKLHQQIMYRRKGNLSKSPNHL